MFDMFEVLKRTQIPKFIIMCGEIEKHLRKIEIKEYERFYDFLNFGHKERCQINQI